MQTKLTAQVITLEEKSFINQKTGEAVEYSRVRVNTIDKEGYVEQVLHLAVEREIIPHIKKLAQEKKTVELLLKIEFAPSKPEAPYGQAKFTVIGYGEYDKK